MRKDTKRLGDGELDIMLAIWGTDQAVNSSYIQEKLKDHRQWTLPAVATALNRLVEKGFLTCEKEGRSNYYRARISEEDYKRARYVIGEERRVLPREMYLYRLDLSA